MCQISKAAPVKHTLTLFLKAVGQNDVTSTCLIMQTLFDVMFIG